MKKKILFTAFNLDVGGIEKCLVNLVNNLDKDKYDITILLQVKEGIFLNDINSNIKVEGYNLSRINNKEIKNKIIKKIVNIFKFIHIILKKYHKYDCSIYYATGYVPSAIVGLLSSKNNIAWMHTNIVTYMDNYKPYKNLKLNSIEKSKKFLKRIFFRRFKKNIFVSNNALDSYLNVYPQDKYKCTTIYNIINYKEIEELSKNKIDMKKDKVYTFINVGRHTEFDKRLSRIIEASSKLVEDNYKFKVLLIGDGKDHNYYTKLAKDKNLEKYVYFLGRKNNPYPYFLISDCFILSSEFEGLPTTIMESLVMNTKIISTNVSDVKELINNKYGIVVDHNSLYDGMKKMIEGKIIIKEKFDPINYNKKIIDQVERILNHE